MAVPEQTPYKEYTANGVTKIFPLEFDVLEQDHLIVLVNDLEPSIGSWSLIDEDVVFSMPPKNGAIIKISRNTPLERTSDYQSYDNSFKPQPVNKDFDRIWWKLQELWGQITFLWLTLKKEIKDRVESDLAIRSWVTILLNNIVDNGLISSIAVTSVESVDDLKFIIAWYGRTVDIGGSRGGRFKYKPDKASINNGVTIFNGWVRQYSGGIYAEWAGADSTGLLDIGPALQKCFDISNTVLIGDGNFLLTSVVGLPYVSNYGDNDIRLTGTGQTKIIVNSTTPVFTSKASLSNPNSTENLFCGKVFVSNINFSTTIEDSKIFNLDRIYNIQLSGNTFYKFGAVGYSSLLRTGENEPYTQSVRFVENNFSENKIVIDAYSIFNLDFSHNFCEGNGIVVNAKDFGSVKSIIHSIRMNENLHEGGGLFLRASNIFTGDISGNYFESNARGTGLSENCCILLNPVFTFGNSCSITNNLFSNVFGNQNNFWVDVRVNWDGSTYVPQPSIQSKFVLERNQTTAYNIVNKDSNCLLINNTLSYSSAMSDSTYPTTPMLHNQSKVSYWFRDWVNLPTVKMSAGNLQLPILKTNLIKQYIKQTSGCTFDLDVKIEIVNATVSIGYIALKIHGTLMNALTKTQQSSGDTSIPDRLYCFANMISIVQADKTVVNGSGTTMNTFFNLADAAKSPKLSVDNITNGQFGYHTLSLNNFNFNGLDGLSTPTGYNMSATLTTYSSGRAFSDVCSGALVRLEID